MIGQAESDAWLDRGATAGHGQQREKIVSRDQRREAPVAHHTLERSQESVGCAQRVR